MWLIKPFTIAQPYFSALLIGAMAIYSVNNIQSRIAYNEKIASELEDKLETFYKFDKAIRIIGVNNEIYRNEHEKKIYNEDIKYQFAGQIEYTREVINLSMEAIFSLLDASKFLEEMVALTPKDEREHNNLMLISNYLKEDINETTISMLYASEILIPYINQYQICKKNSTCDYKNLIAVNHEVLKEYNEKSKKLNCRINMIKHVLIYKQKTEAYKKLFLVWISTLFILYVLIMLYQHLIKYDNGN